MKLGGLRPGFPVKFPVQLEHVDELEGYLLHHARVFAVRDIKCPEFVELSLSSHHDPEVHLLRELAKALQGQVREQG